MSVVDFSRPLATILRESTREAHETVETSPGAVALLSGKLPREEYVRYLMMLWHVYDTLERALDRHATHPALEPTYNPTLLARATALSADISFLLDVPESSWKTHPLHATLFSPHGSPTSSLSSPSSLSSTGGAEPLGAYISRLNELADSSDPSGLLAHAYVRYLGDLSGGQTIRHIIARAYGLDESVGSGVEFYAFKELRSAGPANQGEMKRIKEWFREGLNEAGNVGLAVREAVWAEANTAFNLNTGLFTMIKSQSSQQQPTTKAKPTKSIDSTAVQTAPIKETTASSYSLSQVITVIAAICLGHFILTVGGLTGDRGYAKYIALEQWLRTLWQSQQDSS